MKRKIAAIMAADVVGYSRMIAEDEEDTLRRLISYRAVFSDFVERANGRIFNTAGDAVMAEFPSAVDALRAAIEIQESIRTRNLAYPESRHMRFRIGMTIGDVVEREGDLLGDGVNIAARLEGLAEPGGICISRNVHEQVSNKISVSFRDIGLQSVKNIPNPIQAYQIPVAVPDIRGETLKLAVPGETVVKTEPRSRRGAAAWALLALVLVAGLCATALMLRPIGHPPSPEAVVLVPPRPSTPSANRGETSMTVAAKAPDETLILPFDATPQRDDSLHTTRIFAPDRIPFVLDSVRRDIAAKFAGRSNTAVALGSDGKSGYAWNAADPDGARRGALNACYKSGGVNCQIYAVNNDVVWPQPLPQLPPSPWVDPSAPRTPFDVQRIGALDETAIKRIGDGYVVAKPFKALAIAPHAWYVSFNKSSSEEAERIALELCGAVSGELCRIVAVGDDFVVGPGRPLPIEQAADPNDECSRLAAAPFDRPGKVGAAGVVLAEIDSSKAVPVCRAALAVHPGDHRLELDLARALDRQGGAEAEAADLYQKAAAGGDGAASNILGLAYDAGRLGLMTDHAKAAELFRQAADGGNPQAMRNLALMYRSGSGVPADGETAASLFAKANAATGKWK